MKITSNTPLPIAANKATGSGKYNMLKNQLVILSAGDYSDYYFEGPFICNSDFNLSEAVISVGNGHGADKGPEGAILHLVNSGLISRIDCREIHLGVNGQICLYE